MVLLTWSSRFDSWDLTYSTSSGSGDIGGYTVVELSLGVGLLGTYGAIWTSGYQSTGEMGGGSGGLQGDIGGCSCHECKIL